MIVVHQNNSQFNAENAENAEIAEAHSPCPQRTLWLHLNLRCGRSSRACWQRLALTIILLPLLVGCPDRDADPKVTTTPNTKAEAAVADSPTPPETKPPAEAAKTEAPAEVDPSKAPPASSPTSDSPSTPPKTATDEPGRERLVLLLPGGPLILELVTTIDGRPLGESLDETLARLLNEADGDKDGRVTWDEITRQPAFQRGLYGNMPVGADNDRRQVIQRYDWNRDKIVSRDELLRWLVREPHRAKPLVLDSMVSTREGSLSDSPLMRCLDTDGNGKLAQAELSEAPRRLSARDTDEDDIIDPADLSMTAAMANEPNMARSDASGPALVPLNSKTDWANFQRSMQDAYSLGGPLGPEAWPAATALFQELDLNRDHLIGRSEWATLRVIDPHLSLNSEFGTAGDKLSVRSISPELEKLLDPKRPANLLRFDLPGGRLEIILSPVPVPDYAAQAQATLTMFDADKNNYLEESEAASVLAGAGGTFADVDSNGDGKIHLDELAAASRQRQSIAVDQVRIQAGHRADAWWQVADVDGDGRLDGTEIDTLAQRFQAIDHDQDGAVDRDEIPVTFVLGISRGGQAGAPGMLPPPPGMVPEGEGLPAWFDQMDSNGDRRIGRREFLGSQQLFDKLDRNGDGRLEWKELQDSSAPAKHEPPESESSTKPLMP